MARSAQSKTTDPEPEPDSTEPESPEAHERSRAAAVLDTQLDTIEGIWHDYEQTVRNEDAIYDGGLTDANALRQSTINQARDAFIAATIEADRLYASAADSSEQARRAAVAAARTTRDRRIDAVLHSERSPSMPAGWVIAAHEDWQPGPSGLVPPDADA
jgi:hypothetical protein